MHVQFHYTSDFFGLSAHSDPYSEMERLGKEYCSRHLDEIAAAHPKEAKDNLSKYCFSSIYIPKILKHGFGIVQPHMTARIRRDVNGVKIDWALGAVLHEMLTLKEAKRQSSLTPGTGNASAASAFAPPPADLPDVEVLHHSYLHVDSPVFPSRGSSSSSILICALVIFVLGLSFTLRSRMKAFALRPKTRKEAELFNEWKPPV